MYFKEKKTSFEFSFLLFVKFTGFQSGVVGNLLPETRRNVLSPGNR